MTINYTFQPGGSNELTLTQDDLVSHNPVKTHTGKADLTASFKGNRSLEQYASRQDRLNVEINGSVRWTGYVTQVRHNTSRGTTRIRGEGVERRLEKTRPDYDSLGGSLTYSSISLEDALRDYWARTPFTNFSVTSQSTEQVASDTELQAADTTSEWTGITSISDTTPVSVSSGSLVLEQTAFTVEGENKDRGTVGDFDAERFSGGSGGVGIAAHFDASGETAEYDFTPQHTIPADNVEIQVRFESNNSPALDFTLNGVTWQGINDGVTISNIEWRDFADDATAGVTSGYTGGDLQAGTTYTLRIESTTSGGTNAAAYVDVVAPLDNRYSYTFDNTVTTGSDGGRYLDGPELYPSSLPVELDVAKSNYNITQANITSSWNDTSNSQALAASNDGGATYTSGSNTSSLTVNFTDAGRTGRVKFTFSRYGSRTTATPQTGFNGQQIQDYTLTVDLNDLVVIDSLELDRSHFDNLQTLHDYGDFLYVIEHDSGGLGSLVVSSFQRGDETRFSPASWSNPISKQPEVQSKAYHNSVYLQGAKDNTGSRPTAEVKDQTAITNDGREIQAILRDYNITTEQGARFRSAALLEEMLDENQLVGSITVPPSMTHPGYSRSIDFGDGLTELTVESVSLSQSSGGSEATFEFVENDDFARMISRLEKNARDQGNQI